jgi:hypothetical protein
MATPTFIELPGTLPNHSIHVLDPVVRTSYFPRQCGTCLCRKATNFACNKLTFLRFISMAASCRCSHGDMVKDSCLGLWYYFPAEASAGQSAAQKALPFAAGDIVKPPITLRKPRSKRRIRVRARTRCIPLACALDACLIAH